LFTGEEGPTLTQPAVYFGEAASTYAVVNTTAQEVSLSPAGQDVNTTYDGKGGVQLQSRLRRLAFALRFSEPNLLLSGQISNKSRILYVRDVQSRVRALAPFLDFDSNPYPVVRDGRIFWVVDAYTTSSRYPYGQNADVNEVSGNSDLRKRFNYARNSVKAVVDAYDGTVRFYVVDDTDPILKAYRKAFPELFSSADQIPKDLESHFRYPEDLFRVQTNMFGRYHVTDPAVFYEKSKAWVPALKPGTTATQTVTAPTSSVASTQVETTGNRIAPYFGLMQLPGSNDLKFTQIRTFNPFSDNDSNQKLVSFMTATTDDNGKPQLRVFTMPQDRLPDGPSLVDQSIRSSPEISPLQTQFDQRGSKVDYGQITLMPVGDSLMFVRSFYAKAEGTGTVPELKKVIVSYNAVTYVGDTLSAALKRAFGSAPDLGGPVVVPPTTEPGQPETPATVADLLSQADALYAQATTQLTAGNLGEYQRLINEAFAKVQQAAALSGPVTSTTTTTTTTAVAGSPTTTLASSPTSSTAPATTVAAGATTSAPTTTKPVTAVSTTVATVSA
jgi:uncharacterized membrane protein (UPF0182 family)